MFTIGRCLAAIIGMAFALAGSSAQADNRVALNTTNMIVGRRLAVHSTNENFPADEEANRMLTRPYREPWKLA